MKNEPSSVISDEESEVGCECIGEGKDKERRNKNVYSHKRCGEEIDRESGTEFIASLLSFGSLVEKNQIYVIGWKKQECAKKRREEK